MSGAATVRPARRGDRDGWLEMRTALWPDGAGGHAAEVDAFLDAAAAAGPRAVLVAEEGGRLVGFAELSIRPFAEGCVTDRVGYLEGWFVKQGRRGRGVGRALVEASEAWARAEGCAEFASDTGAGNEASVRAHLACGFQDAGTVRCFRKALGAEPRGRRRP